MRKKRNIYKKYKRIQYLLLKAQNLMMTAANYSEKVKNIFTWYHHKKTYLVLKIVTLTFLAVTFLPLRYIVLFGLLRMFNRGREYHNKVQRYNSILVNEIFKICVAENGLENIKFCLMQPTKGFEKKHH